MNFAIKTEKFVKTRFILALFFAFMCATFLFWNFSAYIVSEAGYFFNSAESLKNTENKPIADYEYLYGVVSYRENFLGAYKNNFFILNNGSTQNNADVLSRTEEPQKLNKTEDFVVSLYSISIPKIGVNSSIVLSIDIFDQKAYEQALTKGVAHALGTALPGGKGNSFIFGHSSAPLGLTRNSASVDFILLHRLDIDDEILIFSGDDKYLYKVFEKKIVSDDSVEYVYKYHGKDTLTLMTCWPPGTNQNRLLIFAEKI